MKILRKTAGLLNRLADRLDPPKPRSLGAAALDSRTDIDKVTVWSSFKETVIDITTVYGERIGISVLIGVLIIALFAFAYYVVPPLQAAAPVLLYLVIALIIFLSVRAYLNAWPISKIAWEKN